MASYKDIKAGCGSRKRYADGGRVTSERKGAKTVINIIAPGGTPAAPPVPPMGNSPSPQAAPVPPAAAQLALSQMQGKPNAFRNGGAVPKGKGLKNSQGGAGGGKGRLAKRKLER